MVGSLFSLRGGGMTIQTVFFDMGGTIETFGFTRDLRLKATPALRSLLEETGIHFSMPDEELLDLIESRLKQYHDLAIQTMDEYPTYRVWSEFILRDIPFDVEPLKQKSEALMFYLDTRFYRREMRPEIPAVLETLRTMGLRIGLISNINSLGQVDYNLREYGIRDCFDPVVCSSEYGRRKPDPAIFHYAARLADTPTSQCLYVGDRITRDVLGARRAGYRLAVQIRHDFDHGEDDSGPNPDRVITDMREVVEIIQHENNRAALRPAGEIRACVFDAGDILYYRPERGRYFGEFLRLRGMDLLENHHVEQETLAHQVYRGLISQTEYQVHTLRLYGITCAEDLEEGLRALRADEDNVTFFEGVTETLLDLKRQGYLLGIITDTANSVSSKLRWFEREGFGHVWDSIISSSEFGTRKPDMTLYRAVLRQLNIPARQAVFIGHKASELEGACAAGMHTLAFNPDPDARADIFIKNFTDLTDLATLLAPQTSK